MILYGIDFLATHHILNLYGRESPKLGWIDHSHVVLEFRDQTSVRAFLNECMLDQDIAPIPYGDRPLILNQWTELEGYKNLTFDRQVFTRTFMVSD
jgi:hypothetical protein